MRILSLSTTVIVFLGTAISLANPVGGNPGQLSENIADKDILKCTAVSSGAGIFSEIVVSRKGVGPNRSFTAKIVSPMAPTLDSAPLTIPLDQESTPSSIRYVLKQKVNGNVKAELYVSYDAKRSVVVLSSINSDDPKEVDTLIEYVNCDKL